MDRQTILTMSKEEVHEAILRLRFPCTKEHWIANLQYYIAGHPLDHNLLAKMVKKVCGKDRFRQERYVELVMGHPMPFGHHGIYRQFVCPDDIIENFKALLIVKADL
jgi:hypothetical protein